MLRISQYHISPGKGGFDASANLAAILKDTSRPYADEQSNTDRRALGADEELEKQLAGLEEYGMATDDMMASLQPSMLTNSARGRPDSGAVEPGTTNRLASATFDKMRETVNDRLKAAALGMEDVHDVLPCAVDALES